MRNTRPAICLYEKTVGALIDGITGYDGDDSLIRNNRCRAALVRKKLWDPTKPGKIGLGVHTAKGLDYSKAAAWHFERHGERTKFKIDPPAYKRKVRKIGKVKKTPAPTQVSKKKAAARKARAA